MPYYSKSVERNHAKEQQEALNFNCIMMNGALERQKHSADRQTIIANGSLSFI